MDPRQSRQGRSPPARVNETDWITTRGDFRRAKTFAPQRPFGRPAPASPSAAAWPPHRWLPTPLRPRPPLSRQPEVWIPVHAPRCRRGSAPLDLGVVRRLLQPLRRTDTPDELPTLARERSFRPTARRHQPMPVASAATVRHRTRGLRAASCARRLSHVALHLRGGSSSRAEALEQRRTRALDEYRACPPRGAPGTRVTGSARRRVWSARRFVAPAEAPLGCHPAKDDTVEGTEVPSAAPEPLRDRGIAPPCAPGPSPRHAASWGGIARGRTRLFVPLAGALF